MVKENRRILLHGLFIAFLSIFFAPLFISCEKEEPDGKGKPVHYVISYDGVSKDVTKFKYSLTLPKEGGEIYLQPLHGSKYTESLIGFSSIYVNGVIDNKYVEEWSDYINQPMDGVSLKNDWGVVSFSLLNDTDYLTTVKIYPNNTGVDRKISFSIGLHDHRSNLVVTQDY